MSSQTRYTKAKFGIKKENVWSDARLWPSNTHKYNTNIRLFHASHGNSVHFSFMYWEKKNPASGFVQLQIVMLTINIITFYCHVETIVNMQVATIYSSLSRSISNEKERRSYLTTNGQMILTMTVQWYWSGYMLISLLWMLIRFHLVKEIMCKK